MDLQKRQNLQKALALAAPQSGLIRIVCADGRLILARCDLTCYETYVELTDKDGAPVSLSYADIASVGAAV